MFSSANDDPDGSNPPASSDAQEGASTPEHPATSLEFAGSPGHASLPEPTVETVIYRLCQPTIFVGREAWKVDICLSGTDIADVHCEIAVLDSEIRVSALDAAVITLNGLEIRNGVINVDDELGIGSCLLRLTTFEGERILAPVTRPCLSATRGDIAIDHEDHAKFLRGRSPDTSGKFGDAAHGSADVAHSSGDANHDSKDAAHNTEDAAHRFGDADLGCAGASVPLGPASASISMDELIAVEQGLSSEHDAPIEKVPRSTPVETSDRVEVPKQPYRQAALIRQFFIIHADRETGPLPPTAVQQLIDAGTLAIDAPIRFEGDDRWQTCREKGFIESSQALPVDSESVDDSPTSHSDRDDKSTAASSTKTVSVVEDVSPGLWRRGCSLASRSVAVIPVFLFQLVSIPNPRPRIHTLKWRGWLAGVLILLAGFGVWRQMNAWSHKALSGRITFASRPVADVIITLSSSETGQSVGSLTDRNGRFAIHTRSGHLPPGRYRVRLSPTQPGQDPASLPPALSEPIIVASTSPVFTTIAANQSDVVIDLRAAARTDMGRPAQ